jgi:MFS family permease
MSRSMYAFLNLITCHIFHRGASTWGRFSAIYYNLHGLNSQHIGYIEGIRSAIPIVSQLFWGIVADSFQSRKRVWLITKTISTVVLLALALPVVYSSFSRILIVSIVGELFVSDGILDAFTLDLLGTANKIYYGRYRLYASLSWGLGSVVMGWVTDHYGFEPNFALFGILGLLMIILVAMRIPDTTAPTSIQEGRTNVNAGKLMELVLLFLRPRTMFFLVEVIIMGAGMATVERLLFLYLVNDLQASTLLCGLSVGVNVLFELPIFWYASKFMAVFGHDGLFMISMTCFVIRVYGYTLLTPATKWAVLLLEVMHGITFACFWITSTDISKILVHQTRGAFWSTAIPSSVNMLYSAVGCSLGSVVGGWAMNRYGSREMYKFTACIVFGTLVLHTIGTVVSKVFFGCSLLPTGDHGVQEPDREDEEEVLSNNESLSPGAESKEDATDMIAT